MIRAVLVSSVLAVAPLAAALEHPANSRTLSSWGYYKKPPPPPPEPTCGNGEIEDGEECDDGNTDSGDGCSARCMKERTPPPGPECGNGEQEGDEQCDDGNTVSGDGCSATCTIERDPPPPAGPDCGDGVVEGDEECEPPNRTGCDASCKIVECPTCPVCPTCGDGNVDPGETCDEGDANGGAACRTDCTFCGDGIINGGEECDGGDNCEPDCTITPTPPPPEPACGDGTVDVDEGETCDEGPANGTDGAACRTDCTFCGDGVVNGGEECDDGNSVPGDGCEPTCTVTPAEPICGDGIVQPPEECDAGTGNVIGGVCRPDCTLPPEECGFCKPKDKSLEIGKPVELLIGWACEGPAPASIDVNKDGTYDAAAGTFQVDPDDIGGDLKLEYGGVEEELHLSCSAPLGRFVRLQSEGQSKKCQGGCDDEPPCTGCFQILEAISEDGIPYCDLDCSQVK